ncbi:hypothetical protein FRC08_004143 [Ceratobasidium sp. 394]|nr:hypothetical protein FRC08_004143 [Ceratobasidium sp. 394]
MGGARGWMTTLPDRGGKVFGGRNAPRPSPPIRFPELSPTPQTTALRPGEVNCLQLIATTLPQCINFGTPVVRMSRRPFAPSEIW